jgi:peptidylprolyl isomerase
VQDATDMNQAPTIGKGAPPPPTTLLTKDLVVGTGAAATATSTVTVQYVGAFYETGEVFDSSWGQAKLRPFDLGGGVIPGFGQGIAGMKVGGRRELVIPPDLGYGAEGAPPQIPANATLVFVIDLKKVG